MERGCVSWVHGCDSRARGWDPGSHKLDSGAYAWDYNMRWRDSGPHGGDSGGRGGGLLEPVCKMMFLSGWEPDALSGSLRGERVLCVTGSQHVNREGAPVGF